MAKNSIYGPDLSVHESQGAAIAKVALKLSKGTGATDQEESHKGDDTSKNNLEKLRKD